MSARDAFGGKGRRRRFVRDFMVWFGLAEEAPAAGSPPVERVAARPTEGLTEGLARALNRPLSEVWDMSPSDLPAAIDRRVLEVRRQAFNDAQDDTRP